ncbi:hypothetical protein FQ087_21145 [Sporosarcina sp. ANT_H38]|uniref:hypothetical protein n=1 Tax=Sporosarcina sp. ANT_H38 TaxID=2597358 RepID=UPI0011F30F1A|nr:hypothetical protein [Sporosarcina sp. ANT_H38]KAA0941661.1 hypothetical protein FQ087_21145 [Sporosarcina sp. ANT_H38]
MVGHNSNDVEAKIKKLQHQTESYLSEIKKMVGELNEPARTNIISYFTYSLNISHDPEQESLCVGSYHIHNLGNQPITNPSVCIKVSKESSFSFSGRYVYADFKQSLKVADGWLRTNEKTNKEEFWLKPLGKASIEPNETISFSNFQITWSPKESYAGSILGYTYSDQLEDGIAVINPINLNGTVHKQGDENE